MKLSPWLLFLASCTAIIIEREQAVHHRATMNQLHGLHPGDKKVGRRGGRFRSQKLPPPNFVGPVCDKPPCTTRMIRVKMYIEDSLWDRMVREARGDPTELIGAQMDIFFSGVNKHLQNLDNGGFKVDFARDLMDVIKLDRSEILLEDTYVDRINGNKTTKFDPTNIFSHTFTFQEAVQKLPDRHSTDLRILFIPERGSDPTMATSEETCICNPDWFGCIAVLSIRFLDNWGYGANLFAHEIGHALGMDLHDDMFYRSNPNDRLLMWNGVGPYNAFIWSPEAKRRINNQDHSCLEKQAQNRAEGSDTNISPLPTRFGTNMWRYLSGPAAVEIPGSRGSRQSLKI